MSGRGPLNLGQHHGLNDSAFFPQRGNLLLVGGCWIKDRLGDRSVIRYPWKFRSGQGCLPVLVAMGSLVSTSRTRENRFVPPVAKIYIETLQVGFKLSLERYRTLDDGWQLPWQITATKMLLGLVQLTWAKGPPISCEDTL